MARWSRQTAPLFFKIQKFHSTHTCAVGRGVLYCGMSNPICAKCGREKRRHRPNRGWECRRCNRGKHKPPPGNRRIPQPIRRALYAAKGDVCPACATPWSEGDSGGAPNRVTIDRLVPGGSYKDIANLRILCGRCNAAKGNLTAAELRQLADWIDREMREMSNPAT